MAKLGLTVAAVSIVCLAALATFVSQQPDIMRDHSNLPPWFAFTFGFKVCLTNPPGSKVCDFNLFAQVTFSCCHAGT